MPFEHVTEIATAFGEKRVSAQRVATNAARAALRYLHASAPVGVHLADQLLVPMALLRGGRFRTLQLSEHTSTNLAVLRAFVPNRITTETLGDDDILVTIDS